MVLEETVTLTTIKTETEVNHVISGLMWRGPKINTIKSKLNNVNRQYESMFLLIGHNKQYYFIYKYYA